MTPRTSTARVAVAPRRQPTSARSLNTARTPASRPTTAPPRLRLARPVPVRATAPIRPRTTLRPLGISVGMVVASLLAVVIGNMALASGQLQLEQAQSRLAGVAAQYSNELEIVNVLKSPATIAHDAAVGGLVAPAQAPLMLPHVPLTKRLGAQRLSDLPCCTFTPGQ